MASFLETLVCIHRTFNHLNSIQLIRLVSLSLVYDTSTTSNVVVLNTIHIDIMDYIMPATCTDTEFRQMWQDFEWENKVSSIIFDLASFRNTFI